MDNIQMNIKMRSISNVEKEINEFSKYEMNIFQMDKSFEKSWASYLTRYEELFFSYMEDENNVIGILGWVNDKVKNYQPLKAAGYDSSERYAFLMAIAIDRKYRGKGLSNNLMEYYVNQCQKNRVDILALRVEPTNEVAINLYKKYGFKEYERHGNNLMMSRRIKIQN